MPVLFLLCLLFISLFCLFLENGNKEGNKAVAEEADLCMADGTVQQDMHAPGTQTRCRQDATPDFPACLCQMEPYRRHGNSGTGRMHPAVSGALYHSHTGNPRADRGTAPVAVSLPLAVNLGTGRGFWQAIMLSPVRRDYDWLYGGTVAAWRPGCAYEDKNLLIKKERESTMKNIRNYGIVTGRLTKDPAVYNNNDGSRKIRFTVAAQNQFTDGDGNRGSQFIPLEAFISARQQGNGPYDYLDCGDLVSCSYTVQNNNYKDRNGEMVYGLVLLVDSIALLESKTSKEARLAAKESAA